MMRQCKKNRTKIIYLFLFLLTSCATKQDLIYFADAEVSKSQQISQDYNLEVQKDALLSIGITSQSPDALKPFTQESESGYLVNTSGEISLPILGSIHVEGMTLKQVARHIETLLIQEAYLKDPKVIVKLMNFKVTILGEVKTPGVKNISSDRVTILEALGLAGDMTIYGIRDRVSIVREENGGRIVDYIDITSKDIFSSPYYYLKPNDVVVVRPNRIREKDSSQRVSIYSYLLSGTALLITVLTFILK